MQVEALVVVTMAVWVVMNFAVTPAIRRNFLSRSGHATLGDVCRLGLAEGFSLTALILALASVATMMALWLLQHWVAASHSAMSLEAFASTISVIQSVRQGSLLMQSIGGATMLVLLAIAFLYVGARARGAQVGAVIAAESRAAIAEKLEHLRRPIEDLSVSTPLREVVDQIHEVEKAMHALGTETASEVPKLAELRKRHARLLKRYLYLALSLDGPVRINRTHIEPMAHRGTWGRIGTFFISTGLFGSLQGAARAAYIVGAALLLPASLVAVGSSSAVATRLASSLDQIEAFRIAYHATQGRVAVLKALDAPPPEEGAAVAVATPPERAADVESLDWCADHDASTNASCDAVVLQHLATMFERAYGDRLLAELVPDGPRQATVRRALVRQAIVQSDRQRPDGGSGKATTAGGPTPQGDVPGAKDWRATRTAEIDAEALDPAFETPTRARFKAFVRSEIIDKRPAVWQRIKGSITAHGVAFQRIPTQSQLAQQLTLRAMGTLLGAAANDVAPIIDSALSAQGPGSSVHASSVDTQMWLFLRQLIQSGDPVAASRRLSELRGLEAGFTEREVTQLQRLAPHIRDAANDAAAVLAQRPATLERRQDVDLDLAMVDAATAKAANARTMKKETLVSLKDYERLFPGGDLPPDQGAGKGPGAGGSGGGGRGGGARDFARMDTSPQNGGVVLGRPRDPGPALDVHNLFWRRADGRISLLLDMGKNTVVLNGFNPGIVHQALVFAADDRKTAVTILNTEVQAQKVFLHPAFVDTPLGCRIIALDKYVFDLTVQDEEVQAALMQARLQPLVYDYVVKRNAQVVGKLIEADGIGNRLHSAEHDDRVSWLRASIEEIRPTSGATAFGTSLLKDAPDLFQRELVSTMTSCARAGIAMQAFDVCIDAASKRNYAAAKASRVAAVRQERKPRTRLFDRRGQSQAPHGTNLLDLNLELQLSDPRVGESMAELMERVSREVQAGRRDVERGNATEPRLDDVAIRKLMPPTTYLTMVSGVRESKWNLDRDFRFARASTAAVRGALDFFVHLPASSPPWFRTGVEPWYSAGFKGESANDQSAQPIRLSSIQPRIDAAIDRYFETPRAREEVPPFAQLVGLNRLFSAALSGDLGDQFPIEKLAVLARVTARDVKFAPTPRWVLQGARGASRPALDPPLSDLRNALRVDAPRGPGAVGPEGGAACPPI